MPHVYSICFQVQPKDDKSPENCFGDITNALKSWVSEKYHRAWNHKIALQSDEKFVIPQPGHRLFFNSIQVDGARLTALRWTHPSEDDSTIEWLTTCSVAQVGSTIEFGLELSVASTSPVIRPPRYYTGRPRIVTELIKTYSCWIGKQPILANLLTIFVPDVEVFVESSLLSTERTLPIVLVSHDRFSDRPTVSAHRIQEKLLGFCQVVVMDKWACFKLTDLLTKPLSCFNGAIRVYWPGLKRDSNPLEHPLYLQETLQKYEYTKRPVEKLLFAILSRVSTFRFGDGALVRDVRRRVITDKRMAQDRTRAERERNISDANAEIGRLRKETNELRELLELSELEKEELRNDLASQKENWQQVRSFQAAAELQSDASAQIEAEPEFSSVAEAVESAQADFQQSLLFYENAKRTSKKSHFARPEQVYRAFEALSEVAAEYFAAISTGESIGPLEAALKRRGFGYSPKESKQTMDMYGDQRRFTHKGKKWEMQKHLTLGGADRTNCVQIYFEPRENAQKFEIGYCGPHLDYKSQTT